MRNFEEYFVEHFDINDFAVKVKIFHEDMNCNQLAYTFSCDEIYFGATISRNSEGKISHYGFYCNILGTDAKKRMSEKLQELIQKEEVIQILNNAIKEEKARVEKVYMQTQSQSLISPKNKKEERASPIL